MLSRTNRRRLAIASSMSDQHNPGPAYERDEDLAGTQRIFTNDVHAETATLLGDHDIVLIPTPTNSPNDPLNWSPWRKYWHATLVLFITAFTAAISNDAGSAGDDVLDELGISYGVQNTAAGVLFLAIGYWTLLASPMPRLWGRRIQYLVCLLSGLGGSIWFATTQTRSDAIWNQLFVGASESCAEALVQLSLSDLFFQHQRGGVLGVYILATSIGTFLGPLIAGYIAVDAWRWVGWWGAIICGMTFVVFLFGLEETSFDRDAFQGQRPVPTLAPPDESKMAEKAVHEPRESSPINSLPNEGLDIPEKRKPYFKRIALITPSPEMVGLGLKQYVRQLWLNMRVFAFPAVLFSGLQWGAQDAWLSFYLTVQETNWYEPPWNYGDVGVSLMNIPTLIGAIIGCIYGGYFSDVFVRWMATRPGRNGISEAEDRLWLLLPSAVINPAGLMLFGIGTARGWYWPGPYIGLGMIGFGWGCAGDLSMAYLMDSYPDMILEGMVGVAVVNNSLACIFTFTASKISAPTLVHTIYCRY